MAATIARVFKKAWMLVLAAAVVACGGGGGDSEPAPTPPLTPQTLSFTAPANQAFSTTPVALVASASSGLAVGLASNTPAVCTVAGSSATLLTVGTCTISATQAGSATVAAATPVVHSFVVSPAAQTITFVSPGNQLMGTTPAALMANASSGLAVGFVSSTPTVCAVNGTALSLLAAGTCTVTASQAGNTNYAAATPVAHSFTVAVQMVAQTVSFTAPGNQTLGGAVPPLVASASSGLPVAFASTTPTICTVNGTAVTLVAPGTCTVAASQAGNANFMAATAVLNSFTVAATPQTITFNSPGAQTLGSAAPALSASATSGLPVSFASTTPAVCTVNGTVLSLLSVGSCTVSASQAGSTTVAAAVAVQQTFAVAAATQIITFAGPGSLTLGTTPAALVASASSGLPVTIESATPSVCTVSGSTLNLLATGTCSLTASQTGNSSFAAASSVTRSVSVSAAPLTAQSITFNLATTGVVGDAPSALVASASSGLTVTFQSLAPTVCTVNGSTLTLVSAGSCVVSASQSGNASFAAAAVVSRTQTVLAAPAATQIVFLNAVADQTLGTAPPQLVGTATSGLAVTFESSTPSVCTVSGSTLTLVAAGTCTVTARQLGNASFAPASASRSFNVAAPVQTLTFISPGNQGLGTTPAALVASSSAGFPVTFSSSTTSVCTVSGTTLTLVAAGNCTITANQAGSGFYAPVSLSRTFAVNLIVELIANGGFEAAPAGGQVAFGWRGVSGRPATWSTDARTGGRSILLAVPDPGLNGSGLAGNSVDDGGKASILGLYVGRTTSLTFWAKGDVSRTGNVNFSLRYLDATGIILNPVVNTSFSGQINPNSWSQISLSGPAIPANTSAIFLEMTLAVGPTGLQTPPATHCGPSATVCDFGQARVLIDDLSVLVNP